MKRKYIQPTMLAVKLQHQSIICLSGTRTLGLGDDNLDYDTNGGDQGSAWTKESGVWDEEW